MQAAVRRTQANSEVEADVALAALGTTQLNSSRWTDDFFATCMQHWTARQSGWRRRSHGRRLRGIVGDPAGINSRELATFYSRWPRSRSRARQAVGGILRPRGGPSAWAFLSRSR